MFVIKKLWIKILVYLLSVAFLSVLLTTALNSFYLDGLLRQFVREREEERDQKILSHIETTYEETGDWKKVRELTPMICMTLNACTKIVDRNKVLIFDYCMNSNSSGPHYSDEKAKIMPIFARGERIGTLYINPEPHRWIWNEQYIFYHKVMQRAIVLIGLFSFAVISLSSPFLARMLVRPLGRIREVISRYTEGEKSARIKDIPSDEFGALAEAFNKMVERIGNLESCRKQLTSDVAHDLRTPLATMQGTIEAMQDGVIPASRENLGSLEEEVQGMTSLIEELQELAELDDPALNLDLRHESLISLVDESLRRIKPALEEKGVATDFLTDGESLVVLADRKKMGRVFYNIFQNALKFTPAGKHIVVKTCGEDKMAHVSIKDEGVGIDEKDVPFIFDRFYRAERSRSGRSSGLGLAIAKNIMDLHEGRIEVKSKTGEGTEFIISLTQAEG
jgi:two-component system, OmpR family, sensor histidine kinase BaeS